MFTESVKSIVRRLLRVLGLARASELDRERTRRTRAERQLTAQARRLGAAQKKLQQAEDRAGSLHAQLSARRDKLRSVEDRLARAQAALAGSRARTRCLEALYGDAHTRLMGQLAVRASRETSLAPSPDAASLEHGLEVACADYARAKVLWRESGKPDGTRQTSIGNLTWFVPPDLTDAGSLSHRLLERHRLPLDDIALVRQFVVGGVMLDIGANIGTTAIPRVVLGDFARVYAAEPNSDNYLCLVGNVIENGLSGRVLPDRAAISSTSGRVRISRSRKIGSHRLQGEVSKPGEVSEVVPCFTVDDWLERLRVEPGSVTFVKVDTQGWDLHVLQGAQALLDRRDVVWQIEISPAMMRRAGSSIQDLCALVSQYFSHVRELSPHAEARHVPASDAGRLLASLTKDRGFANLLLFNLQVSGLSS